MLELYIENSYKRDLKKIIKRGINADIGKDIIFKLQNGIKLEEREHNHPLIGDYVGYWECKISPDLLLIYKIVGNELHLVRIGSHTELFKKY